MVHQRNQEQIEAVIMGLDAEKAFDSVKWSFLYKTLHKCQFNKNVIQTIKALYNKPTARIKRNGSLSGPVELERGCRQGCPISPLLFALFIASEPNDKAK